MLMINRGTSNAEGGQGALPKAHGGASVPKKTALEAASTKRKVSLLCLDTSNYQKSHPVLVVRSGDGRGGGGGRAPRMSDKVCRPPPPLSWR